MKTTITILLLVIINYTYAQVPEADYTINYGYDNAGNRTTRTHTSSSNATIDSDAKEDITLEEIIALLDDANKPEKEQNKENEQSIRVTVYPNPATERISVSTTTTNDTKNTDAVYILLDSKGKILDKIKSTDNLVTFQVSHLAKGIYYVCYLGAFDSAQAPTLDSARAPYKKAWRIVKE